MEFVKRYFVRRRNLWSSEFKTPKALFESACESTMRLAYVCGAEIFRQNYTRNNRRLALLYADFTLYLVISSWCLTADEIWYTGLAIVTAVQLFTACLMGTLLSSKLSLKLAVMHAIKRSFVRQRNLWSCEFKNPKAMYESACANVTTLAFVCGTERFCPHYSRRNSRLILLLIDITLYLVLSFWCVTVLWGQLNDVIFCFVTMGGAVQVWQF
ncbi:Odorant receptor 94b [Culex quinquefasciatus]|uniref:Odorant receptor 94b n=1 Tax=Culex quinquefasciatus TaxID=7176 RepID=B0X045_CULQU|nr:Odorant receptor 94b [Culex quinquefasciatus]|eukprot:XP_001863017.1 Odorant receptor 94b [Culex quinquefasciatus]